MITDSTEESAPLFEQNSVTEMRRRSPAIEGDDALGPLKLLPGTWGNIRVDDRAEGGQNPFVGSAASPLNGRGWNMIALPFVRDNPGPNYRLMMNQYNEVLSFDFVSDAVPNRGIRRETGENTDQDVSALDYTQQIRQLSAADDGPNGDGLDPSADIHHEPGFFLHMRNQNFERFNIARLATIPHGNSATAIGKSREMDGAPVIPALSGLPEGATSFDVNDEMVKNRSDGYLAPYFRFSNQNETDGKGPFQGELDGTAFPGFFPDDANFLLNLGLSQFEDRVTKTTELVLDTDVLEGGIVNIPFIERQADAALMRSTFWIMELDEEGPFGEPRKIMAYSQFIFLDFFQRRDGRDGLIRWPHISINMMEKIAPGAT